MTTETLTSKPVTSPHETYTTVLLFDSAASEPVRLGNLDGDTWHFIDCMPAAPTYWTALPGGPTP